jgi:hypothetical protein
MSHQLILIVWGWDEIAQRKINKLGMMVEKTKEMDKSQGRIGSSSIV